MPLNSILQQFRKRTHLRGILSLFYFISYSKLIRFLMVAKSGKTLSFFLKICKWKLLSASAKFHFGSASWFCNEFHFIATKHAWKQDSDVQISLASPTCAIFHLKHSFHSTQFVHCKTEGPIPFPFFPLSVFPFQEIGTPFPFIIMKGVLNWIELLIRPEINSLQSQTWGVKDWWKSKPDESVWKDKITNVTKTNGSIAHIRKFWEKVSTVIRSCQSPFR